MSRRRFVLFVVLPVALIACAIMLYTPDASRSALETRYLEDPADLRTIAGMTVHVRDNGPRSAPAIIMLHGMGASLHTWEPWARALSDSFRVIRFDLPGHGLTPADPTSDYRDTRSHEIVAALMDTLGIARATLIGNSMGGRIAWSFAAEDPERVDKLVLISPDGFASPGFAYDTPAEVPASMGLMRYVLPRWMLRLTLAPAYANPEMLSDSLAARYHAFLIAPGARDAMLERMQQTVLTDPVPRLRRVQAKTLLLWGELDAMIPISNAQDYLDVMPHAQMVRLPGLGHLPFEEGPAQALPPLRAFLNDHALRGQ